MNWLHFEVKRSKIKSKQNEKWSTKLLGNLKVLHLNVMVADYLPSKGMLVDGLPLGILQFVRT